MYPMEPGHYPSYPSSAVSEYYCWFKYMGYPNLDLMIEGDGAPTIIEYLNAPIIPSMTSWARVINFPPGFPISYTAFRKQILARDLHRDQVWEDEEKKTQKILEEKEAQDRETELLTEEATKTVMKSRAIKERIAKNGMSELGLEKLAAHVPKHELKAMS